VFGNTNVRWCRYPSWIPNIVYKLGSLLAERISAVVHHPAIRQQDDVIGMMGHVTRAEHTGNVCRGATRGI